MILKKKDKKDRSMICFYTFFFLKAWVTHFLMVVHCSLTSDTNQSLLWIIVNYRLCYHDISQTFILGRNVYLLCSLVVTHYRYQGKKMPRSHFELWSLYLWMKVTLREWFMICRKMIRWDKYWLDKQYYQTLMLCFSVTRSILEQVIFISHPLNQYHLPLSSQMERLFFLSSCSHCMFRYTYGKTDNKTSNNAKDNSTKGQSRSNLTFRTKF